MSIFQILYGEVAGNASPSQSGQMCERCEPVAKLPRRSLCLARSCVTRNEFASKSFEEIKSQKFPTVQRFSFVYLYGLPDFFFIVFFLFCFILFCFVLFFFFLFFLISRMNLNYVERYRDFPMNLTLTSCHIIQKRIIELTIQFLRFFSLITWISRSVYWLRQWIDLINALLLEIKVYNTVATILIYTVTMFALSIHY